MLDTQRLFGSPRPTLVCQLNEAIAEALRQADFINCNELTIFQALVICLTR